MKEFNTTAICVPELHYMVDTTEKMQQIEKLIAQGNYFTINRARQYGKTTMMYSLCRKLKTEYLVLNLSFEGWGDKAFSEDETFVNQFLSSVTEYLEDTDQYTELLNEWNQPIDAKEKKLDAFDLLSKRITWFCKLCPKKIILMIDEVDKSSDNQIFLHFLGMLRNKYIKRVGDHIPTFWSVILAGVYDIKNMKLKLRPDEEKKYNSPWNIAVDFEVDMSFSPKEIATMLQEYEDDHHTGMDIAEMSEELYKYTNGYPYLVSWLCKWMDNSKEPLWTKELLLQAEKEIHKSDSTLLDSVSKNYENHPDLQKMLNGILYEGKQYTYIKNDSTIRLGSMFGILKEKDNQVHISNMIFENNILGLIISKCEQSGHYPNPAKDHFIDNGKLNIVRVLQKFQELMKAEYRQEDETFLEKQGRLLFLCFIKPIINGTGFYYVEPETRNNERMDLVITYGGEEHIVELKIWHGEEYRKKGIAQLEEYLDSRNSAKGYLLSFSFLKNKEYVSRKLDESETIKDILEVVV